MLMMNTVNQILQQGRTVDTLEQVAQNAERRLSGMSDDSSDNIISRIDTNSYPIISDNTNFIHSRNSYEPYIISSVSVPADRVSSITGPDDISIDKKVNIFYKRSSIIAKQTCPFGEESDQYNIWMDGFMTAMRYLNMDCRSDDAYYTDKEMSIEQEHQSEKRVKDIPSNGITPMDEAVEEEYGIDIELEEET